jgi:hypothetical protein
MAGLSLRKNFKEYEAESVKEYEEESANAFRTHGKKEYGFRKS